MNIRKMTAGEVMQVAAMEQAIFSEPWSADSLLQAAASDEYCYLLAMEGEEVFGYAGMIYGAFEGQVTNVAVKQEYRGRGLGTALMQALLAEAEAHHLPAVTLEVRSGNLAARAVYEKLGFRAAGVRKNYYRKPTEDGVIYWFGETSF